jgi:hypothetical protein
MPERRPTIHIELSDDGQTVTMGNEVHRHSFPVADLPKWVRTYNDLRDRNKGQYARFYTETCDKLAALTARLAAGPNPTKDHRS